MTNSIVNSQVFLIEFQAKKKPLGERPFPTNLQRAAGECFRYALSLLYFFFGSRALISHLVD